MARRRGSRRSGASTPPSQHSRNVRRALQEFDEQPTEKIINKQKIKKLKKAVRDAWSKRRQLREQGPLALLELLNLDPADLRVCPEVSTRLTEFVRAVMPDAPAAMESTLSAVLARGGDPELADLLEHLRWLGPLFDAPARRVEWMRKVATGVVTREALDLYDAARFGGPVEPLVRAVRTSATDRANRPARIVAQAILRALDKAPPDWLARLCYCPYAKCRRPWFWSAGQAPAVYCCERHRIYSFRSRSNDAGPYRGTGPRAGRQAREGGVGSNVDGLAPARSRPAARDRSGHSAPLA
jgi:hypothetical protein